MQLTNIAHVKDLSSMLVLAVQKPFAANGNIFNAVCDRAITLDGLVKLCAKVAGKKADIVHYDPKSLDIDAKKAFPFRNMVNLFLHFLLNYMKTLLHLSLEINNHWKNKSTLILLL